MTIVKQPKFQKTRLYIGSLVFICGFLSPLLIPFISKLNLSIGLKTALSGLLAFGVPEIFMIASIAIMGKDGYNYLKGIVFNRLKIFAPTDEVSLTRYRIGIIMFSVPLIVGFITPYINLFFEFQTEISKWIFIFFDIVFVISFFVLGGNFWDKVRGLFSHKAVIVYKKQKA